MSRAVRDEVERLRAAMHEQLRKAEKVMGELRRIQEMIAEVLKKTDPDAAKTTGKSKRHR